MRQKVEKLRTRVKAIRDRAVSMEAVRDRIEADLVRINEKIAALELTKEKSRKGTIFLEKVGETIREETWGVFEEIVLFALQSVFGDSYDFEIRYKPRKDRGTCQFLVNGVDPVTSCGGGVVDVLAFALRLTVLEVSRPRVELPLIMDEPFKHLGRSDAPAAAEICRELAVRTGRQIIIVTHQEEFLGVADKVVEIR